MYSKRPKNEPFVTAVPNLETYDDKAMRIACNVRRQLCTLIFLEEQKPSLEMISACSIVIDIIAEVKATLERN